VPVDRDTVMCLQVGTKLSGREELKAEWERFQKQRVRPFPAPKPTSSMFARQNRLCKLVSGSPPHDNPDRRSSHARSCFKAQRQGPDPCALDPAQEARKMAAEVDYHGVCILKVWLQTQDMITQAFSERLKFVW